MKINKKKLVKIGKILNKNSKLVISTIALLIMLVAATVAWFTMKNTSWVEGFQSKISLWDFIVSKTPDGEPIGTHEGDVINIETEIYSNVLQGMMAPGTYSKFTVYIRSSAETSYGITFNQDNQEFVPQPLIADFASLEAEDVELDTLVKMYPDGDYTYLLEKHFKFYSVPDCTPDTEITLSQPKTGTLRPVQLSYSDMDPDRPNRDEITLYWRWLYDADELLDGIQFKKNRGIQLQPYEQLLSDKLDSFYNDEEGKEAFLEQYRSNWDYEDNFISKYHNNITGNISMDVVGAQGKPQM